MEQTGIERGNTMGLLERATYVMRQRQVGLQQQLAALECGRLRVGVTTTSGTRELTLVRIEQLRRWLFEGEALLLQYGAPIA
jgi:hypothetical protein